MPGEKYRMLQLIVQGNQTKEEDYVEDALPGWNI